MLSLANRLNMSNIQTLILLSSQRWVPRFGMKKVQADKEKNWVKEVPGNVDPYEDMFAKEKELKRERVAKNEYQRLRNIAKSRKLKVPNVGVTGNDLATSKDVSGFVKFSPSRLCFGLNKE